MALKHRLLPALVLTCALTLLAPAMAAFASAPAGAPGLEPTALRALKATTPVALSGTEAVRTLGPDLAAIAAAHGKSTAELARALKSDRRLFIDARGRLYYREAPLGVNPAEPMPASALPEAFAAGSDAFALHSKPDAKRVIFLDFDGHVLSGTVWNAGGADIVAPAWDIEGGPEVFTTAERATIAQIWARVAEDYAPFDVDVTTEDPGEDRIHRSNASDEYYGMRTLISPISSYFGSYGGFAYVGVFDMTGSSYYKPALVFPENLGNSEKTIAEACSHETGHTLGLLHDGTTSVSYYAGHGTGETGWAPIMGTSYYRNVTQWSRGEYAGANNTEDDLAIIRSHGVAYRPDDHGDSAETATALTPSPAFEAAGIIATEGDTDALLLTVGAGTLSVTATPQEPGPNLDILLELRSADGTLVASAQPGSALAASLSADVAAGAYTLLVRAVGTGDPSTGYSAYATLGGWRLYGTAAPADAPPPNAPPSASFTATPLQGTAPLVVGFDASASTDGDGSIVHWSWEFGDGTTGTGQTTTHTYATAGAYWVTLAVTDNGGLTGVATAPILVTSPSTLHVGSITLTPVTARIDRYVQARVVLLDHDGRPVPGAAVKGTWGGILATTSTSGTTDADGIVTLTSRRTKKSGTVTFAVTSVSAPGSTYVPGENVVTVASLVLAAPVR